MNVSDPGFITGPWIVRGAALTEATPAPYSASSGRGSFKYYVDFEKTINTPKWDKWVEIKNPISTIVSREPLASTELQFLPIKKTGTLRPVFKVTGYRILSYAYEWKRDVKIEGWIPGRNDFADVPDWFEWF